jgi:hypothetical protein
VAKVLSDPKLEVTYIGKGEPFTVRMVNNRADDIVRAAETLKARFAILVDEVDYANNVPIWSVFDLSKLPQKMMGQHVFPLASKRFRADKPDAAIMWAFAQLGK